MPEELVAVIWDDAHSEHYNDEVEMDEGSAECAEVVTYGFITKENERAVRVSGEMTSPDHYRGHTEIPRTLIKRIVRVRKMPVRAPGWPRKPKPKKVDPLPEPTTA